MSTGLNPMVDAMMIVGAHANAGSPGVISHNFAFDSFTVNGKALNEAGHRRVHRRRDGRPHGAGQRRRRADRGDTGDARPDRDGYDEDRILPLSGGGPVAGHGAPSAARRPRPARCAG